MSSNWAKATLGEIVIQNKGLQTGPFGSQLHSHEYTEAGIPVIMPKDMNANKVSIDTIARIPESKADELSKHRLQKGDIVFGRRGDIGRCALITEHEEGWLCGTGCIRARLSEDVLPEFVILLLDTPLTIFWLESNAVGQTMLNLNTQILGGLPVFLPPLAEQKAIAQILGTWDEAIQVTEALIDALGRRKQGLMQRLLTGEVRFPEFEGEWDEVKLGDVVDSITSGLSRKLSIVDIGLPVLTSSNLQDEKVDYSSIKYWYRDDPQGADTSNYFLKDGDILVNFINSMSQIGKSAIYENKLKRDMIYTTNIFRIRPNSKLIPKYLFSQTMTTQYKKYIASITKPAVNQASFTTKEFRKFIFKLPKMEEQIRIIDVLSDAYKAIELMDRYRITLQEQKRGLMQVLLTGQVRVGV
jgi:type I restriction enzyme, S subunit